ncbi:MAG: phosphohydrolase [Candidatus Cloacimonetes bacterium]|nr:phosphohydrolase [Candidatus Cloacimonadota bacterium]
MKKAKIQDKYEKKILKKLSGKAKAVAKFIFQDKEIIALQDIANVVSIKRLGFNDHGPVHMLKAANNAMRMFELLQKANIKMNMVKEGLGNTEDSKIAVLIASLLHDIGMSVTRDNHEMISLVKAEPIINRILEYIYDDDLNKKLVMKTFIEEGIIGHMGTQKIHSLEAGFVLIGDGCDMEKGRARIPILLSTSPRRGDIHKYSSRSINKVKIEAGDDKPIKIVVKMSHSIGVFQLEEVLYPKIASSPVKPYVELYGNVAGKENLQYF